MARRKGFAVAAPSLWGQFFLRLAGGILVLIVALFLTIVAVGACMTYYILTRRTAQEAVTPQSYLLSNYIPVNFSDRSGGEHEGWLLLGLRGAPVIILSHGYDSNRSDFLSLGAILRDNHFNVFLFNFHGPRAKEAYSNLGDRQASDLISAIETVTKQVGVNPNRVGLFGPSMGGYASLVAAEINPKVKALIVDTTYTTPLQMYDTQIDRLLGGSSQLFRNITETEFRVGTTGMVSYQMMAGLSKLQGVPKLFIWGRDHPSLAAMTEEIYNQAPPPKQPLVMEHSVEGLASEAEKSEYENQVLNFFLQNLSLRAD